MQSIFNKIYKPRIPRKTASNPAIVVNHTADFLGTKVTYNPADVLEKVGIQSTSFNYMAKEVFGYNNDFSHYYIDLNKYNYLRISALGLFEQSPFLNELANNRVIKADYRNSILITLIGDYSFDIPDKQMLDSLGYLIAGLQYTFKIATNRVFFLTDLTKNFSDELEKYESTKGRTNIKEMSKLPLGLLRTYITKYKL